ncbi:MAG: hypothetical protein HY056_17520 [Proteobacteria bacterium]|nr:hypothetical protein [Pseudomonadota bacterium]
MSSDLILLAHATFGALAILAAVWVFVEALNAKGENQGRIQSASLATAGFIWAAYLFGGYWYVLFYGADKARIVSGPWPFAHNFFMETKEHVFLGLLLLATFLPIAAFNNIADSRGARTLVIWCAAFVVLIGLAMEGAGAFISMGVKLALIAKAI